MFTQLCCDHSGHIVCNDVLHICLPGGFNDNPLSQRSQTQCSHSCVVIVLAIVYAMLFHTSVFLLVLMIIHYHSDHKHNVHTAVL